MIILENINEVRIFKGEFKIKKPFKTTGRVWMKQVCKRNRRSKYSLSKLRHGVACVSWDNIYLGKGRKKLKVI